MVLDSVACLVGSLHELVAGRIYGSSDWLEGSRWQCGSCHYTLGAGLATYVREHI